MRKTLSGLQPNTKYAVRARSTLDGQVSEWSQVFVFDTLADAVAPNPVTNLTGTTTSGNFSFTWDAPTLNVDGTALKDLKDYKVVVSSALGTTHRDFYVTDTRLDLSVDDVTSIFFLYVNTITVTVYAEDYSNNISTPVTFTIQKAKPLPPTSLTWTVQGTSFIATWVAPTQDTAGKNLTNLKDYEVTITAGIYTRYFYTTSTNYEFSMELNRKTFVESGLFTTPQGSLTITVAARDSFNETSTTVNALAQNPVPAIPANLAGTAGQDQVSLKWSAVADLDVTAYRIYANSTNSLGTATKAWEGNATSYIHSTVAYSTDHYFWVTALDAFGQTNFSTPIGPFRPTSGFGVDTTPPSVPTGLTGTPGLDPNNPYGTGAYIDASWTANAAGDGVAGYRLRVSQSATGPWDYMDLPAEATSARINFLQPNKTYYIGVQAYDAASNRSTFSANYSQLTSKDATLPAAPGTVSITGYPSSFVATWPENTEVDVAGGKGYYEFTYSTSATFASGNVVRNVTAGIASVTGLAQGVPYYVRVRAFDASGNASATYSTGSITLGTAASYTSDGVAPTSSPTPVVNPLYQALEVKWSPLTTNADPVTYEVHVSTTSGFAPVLATKALEVAGTFAVIKTLPGTSTPLAYGTTYYVKTVAKDRDGSHTAGSTQASGIPLQVDNGDLAANSVRANNIQAGSISTDKLTVGATFNQIKNGGMEDYGTNPGGGNWAPTSWYKPSYEVQSFTPVTGSSSIAGGVSWLSTTVQPTTGGVEASFFTVDYYACTPGEKWFATATIKTGVATTQGMYLQFWWYDANKTALTTTSTSDAYVGPTTGAIQTVGGSVTVPAGAAYFVLYVSLYAPNVATTITIGDVNAGRSVSTVQIADGGITADKLSIGGTTTTTPVLNGGFEDAGNGKLGSIAAGWQDWSNGTGGPGGTGVRTGLAAYSGSYGISMGTSGSPYLYSNQFPLSPGEQLSMALTAKLVSGTAGLYLRISFRNAAGAEIGISDPVSPSTTPSTTGLTSTWTTYGGQSIAAPAGTVGGIIQVYNTSGAVYVDNVDVRRLATGTTIADGVITTSKIVTTGLNAQVIQTGFLRGDLLQANTVDAGILKGGTTFTSDLFVASNFTLGNTLSGPGTFQSYNYVTSSGTQGFRLNSSGLDIQSGSISAKALLVQDSANIVPPEWAGFEANAATYNFTGVSGGVVSLDTAHPKYGTTSLKHVAQNSDSFYYLVNSGYNIPVDPNTTYIASIWVYQESGSTISNELYIQENGGGSHFSNASNTLTNIWKQIYFTFTTPSNCTAVRGRVDNNTNGTTCWWDGFQVERKIANSDVPSAWKPPGLTSIDGGIIKTGSIQSTSTVQTGNGEVGQPLWSINTNGFMDINSARIRGKIVIGDSTSSYNTNISIASWNYGVGTANSWAIKGDGTFNIQGASGAVTLNSSGLTGGNGAFTLNAAGLTVTGTINASSGTINGPMTINGGSLSVNANGTQNNVRLDANGLYAYGATAGDVTAAVQSNGSLYAKQGLIGGWTINATSLYNGSLTIDSSQGLITSGSGNTTVSMQAGVGIWAGAAAFGSAFFRVNTQGQMVAVGANIIGDMHIGSNIYGANYYTANDTVTYPRISMGPGITYQSYPALVFDWGNGPSVANGIVSTSNGRIQLVGSPSNLSNSFIDLNTPGNRIDIGFNGISGNINLSAPVTVGGALTTGSYDLTGNNIRTAGGFVYTPRIRGFGGGQVIFDTQSDTLFQNSSGRVAIYGAGSTTVFGEFFTSVGSGNVRIGIGNGGANATAISDGGAAVLFQRNDGASVGGSTYVAIKCQTVLQNSTESTKRNIETHTYGLETLKKLRSVKYERGGRQNLGFIANEIAEVMPEAVHYEPDDAEEFGNVPGALMGVDLGAMISLLMKSSQELADINVQQVKTIEKLSKRLDALEKGK